MSPSSHAVILFTSILSYILTTTHAIQFNETFGYLSIRPDAEMFYWLMRSDSSDNDTRPLVIYLAGGPGDGSSGISNFAEVGPFDMDGNERRDSWLTVADLLFIDAPVGSGFSYVRENRTFSTDNQMIVEDLILGLKMFLSIHPEYKIVDTYLFGESYGSRYAIATGNEIHKQVNAGLIELSLKGVGLGSPWIDPLISTKASADAYYAFSLIDKREKEMIDSKVNQMEAAMNDGNETQVYELMMDTLTYTYFKTFQANPDNVILKTSRSEFYTPIDVFMNRSDIRHKLNIPPNVTYFGQKDMARNSLSSDSIQSVRHEVEHMLNNTDIKVIVYGGQLDVNVPLMGIQELLDVLNWSGSHGFREAEKSLFFSDTNSNSTRTSKVFKKEHENLSLFSFTNAGHFVPIDQPEAALQMLKHVISQ